MNTTTLNMTTLDGGVIIKKGEGGGGATINNQDKVVDITENGTTEVVADGGFTGLGKVTINTEVSGGESGGNWVYANLEQLGEIENIAFGIFAMLVKLEKDGEVQIVPAAYARILEQSGGDWKDVGIDISVKVVMSGYGVMTMAEALVVTGVDINSMPKITEEQFYNLD